MSLQQAAQTTQSRSPRRRDRGRGRLDRAARQRPGDLERSTRHQAGDRDHHDHGRRPARPPIPAPFAINSGTQTFIWDGRGNDGTTLAGRQLHPDGHRGFDASGQSVADLDPGGGQGQIRSISPRHRRFCRSTGRTTRSTRCSRSSRLRLNRRRPSTRPARRALVHCRHSKRRRSRAPARPVRTACAIYRSARRRPARRR